MIRPSRSPQGRRCLPSPPAHRHRPGAPESPAPDSSQSRCAADRTQSSSGLAEHRPVTGHVSSCPAAYPDQRRRARKTSSAPASRRYCHSRAAARCAPPRTKACGANYRCFAERPRPPEARIERWHRPSHGTALAIRRLTACARTWRRASRLPQRKIQPLSSHYPPRLQLPSLTFSPPKAILRLASPFHRKEPSAGRPMAHRMLPRTQQAAQAQRHQAVVEERVLLG